MHALRGIQWCGFGELDYKVLNQRAGELGTSASSQGPRATSILAILICF